MSRFSVSMLDEAVEDILIGNQFYEGNEEGVGAYFAASALAEITSLGIYAGIHSVHFGYFRLLMKRFPFAVYYEKEEELVEVIAVLDMRRNPRPFAQYWLIGRPNKAVLDNAANAPCQTSTFYKKKSMKTKLRFLNNPSKKSAIRTNLYGDVFFDQFELEVVHTPVFQRLYGLMQLGFAYLVFPDAIHTRFNHVIGVVHQIDNMAEGLRQWNEGNQVELVYHGSDQPLKQKEIKELLDRHLRSIRLTALLHDLTHSAFGHTLEDEVHVFEESHDDPQRQIAFFNSLFSQLVILWSENRFANSPHLNEKGTISELLSLSYDEDNALDSFCELFSSFQKDEKHNLGQCIIDLDFAFRILLNLDTFKEGKIHQDAFYSTLLTTRVLGKCSLHPIDFDYHKHGFMVDMLGNTICADLLDYAIRDSHYAGVKTDFDTRIIRYLALCSASGDYSPTHNPCIRLCTRLFTNRIRYDVLSDLSSVLRSRYRLSQIVLFYPTKCAASSLLSTALMLLGVRVSQGHPRWIQTLTDRELIFVIYEIINTLEESISDDTKGERLQHSNANINQLVDFAYDAIASSGASAETTKKRIASAKRVLFMLQSRRLPLPVYRIGPAARDDSHGADQIAEKYIDPDERYALERKIEEKANMPMGSVFYLLPEKKSASETRESSRY